MSRDVPFSENEKCDFCDNVGAYDFMGDLVCPECCKKYIKSEEGEEE